MKIYYLLFLTSVNAFLFNPLKRSTINQKNILQQTFNDDDYFYFDPQNNNDTKINPFQPMGIRVIIGNGNNGVDEYLKSLENQEKDDKNDNGNDPNSNPYKNRRKMTLEDMFNLRMKTQNQKKSSENFKVETDLDTNFDNVGGYLNIKSELNQCSDLLINFEKYQKFNVRTPKGLILEGPPGNGKTLLARAFSGETNSSFISVSGSEFQEKYVGVGSSRVRELFDLAEQNKPCIIFIDEIDAIGRARSSDGESSNAERDNTLNQLLVKLDGYKKTNGVFLMCATNRIDLLDPALLRPGRIDKKIYVDNPDAKTREEIIKIHIKGKPYDAKIDLNYLIEITAGKSGAEIENLLNEAMLTSLRDDRERITMNDLENVLGKGLVGWKSTENIFSPDMLKRIAIHEIGHALTGLLSKDHAKLSKIHLNSWAPNNPGYTIFETEEVDVNIYTKQKLFSHLVVLLAGRQAEQVFYGESVTTGASHDFEQAYKLAESMILKYGMGTNNVLTYSSDKSKENVDNQIFELLEKADKKANFVLSNCKPLIEELANSLIDTKKLDREAVEMKIYRKNPEIFKLEF